MSTNRYFLKEGDFLRVGEFLSSSSGKYFATMEANGNFALYRGNDPANKAELLWQTGPVVSTFPGRPRDRANFYVVMQADGNLVIYKGTSPNDNQGGVWNSGVTESGGFFCTAIRDDGTLAMFKGHDLNNDQNMIWNSGRFHLKQDDYLLPGGMLISPNKGFFATLLSSGELIVCRGVGLNAIERKVWSSNTTNNTGRCYLYLQGDANLIAFKEDQPRGVESVLWNSGLTATASGFSATMQNNGLLVIRRDSDRKIIWSSSNNILTNDQFIRTSDLLVSDNQKYIAIMQSDGNFVVYEGPDFEHRIHHIWSHGKTSTGNQFFAYMQGDGNFAVYKGTSLPARQEYLWGCLDKSLPNGRYFAVIQDDGNFMIYSGNSIQNRGNVIWESGRVVEHDTSSSTNIY